MIRYPNIVPLALAALVATYVQANDSPESIAKPKPTALSWQRTSEIDVKHISLALQCDWSKKRIKGTSTIRLAVLKASDFVALDAAHMQILSIRSAEGAVLPFQYDGGDRLGNLKIQLGRVHRPDDDFAVTIEYESTWQNRADPNNIWGSFGKGLRFQLPTSTAPTKRKQMWSSGQPQSNRYWFPGHETPDDLRTTDIQVVVDQDLTAIATGNLTRLDSNHDGTRTFHFEATTPHPNYLTSINVGNYVDVLKVQDGIPLHTFGYPDERDAVVSSIARLPEMIRFFSQATGRAYPFKQYTQVVVQDYPFPGRVGQHACVTVSDNMIDDHRTHEDFLYLWDGVEAHGLASQWFGNLIMPEDWSHIWLSESFAHYMNAMFNIERNGLAEYLTFQADFEHATIMADWQSGYRHPIVTEHFADIEEFVTDNHAKFRGALVLHMLRREVGEGAWKEILRQYTNKYEGRLVTTDDFASTVDSVVGRSMHWFFEQWLYKMGHPVFDVSHSYDAENQTLALSVKQTQKPETSEHPQAEFFQGHVEVEIDAKRERVWLAAKPVNTFTFPADAKPRFIHFDAESTWIKEITFDKSLDEWIHQSQLSTDPLGQRAAVVQLAQIGKQESTSKFERKRILEAIRAVIASDKYWRVRVRAIAEIQNLFSRQESTQSLALDQITRDLLTQVIKNERSWLRVTAIGALGATRDKQYESIYQDALNDESDRVINAAAIALGKTQSDRAFDALVRLKDKPSWKNQSLISSLNGLKELKDPRGAAIALSAIDDCRSPRWWLATPIWDYPVAAAETLVALNKAELAYPIVRDRFFKSLNDDDDNDVFANALLVAILADKRGAEVFEELKTHYRDDANAKKAIDVLEQQYATNKERLAIAK